MLSSSSFASKFCKNKKKPCINKFHNNNHADIVLAQNAWNSTCLITCVTEQGQTGLNFQCASTAVLLQMSLLQHRNEPVTASCNMHPLRVHERTYCCFSTCPVVSAELMSLQNKATLISSPKENFQPSWRAIRLNSSFLHTVYRKNNLT